MSAIPLGIDTCKAAQLTFDDCHGNSTFSLCSGKLLFEKLQQKDLKPSDFYGLFNIMLQVTYIISSARG